VAVAVQLLVVLVVVVVRVAVVLLEQPTAQLALVVVEEVVEVEALQTLIIGEVAVVAVEVLEK
jgi:hypothetical protein